MTLLSSGFQLRFITQNLRKFGIRLLIQSGIMGNNNRTRFYAVSLGVLLVFCEISDCTICEFCGADFVHLGKHVWRCKQRIQPVNHPTVDNPMRPPDTSTSLTNDQYNGNHAHSIINEERHLMSPQPNKALTIRTTMMTVTRIKRDVPTTAITRTYC